MLHISEAKRAEAHALALDALAKMTDEEDAEITRAAETDLDNGPLTQAELDRMRDAAIPFALKRKIRWRSATTLKLYFRMNRRLYNRRFSPTFIKQANKRQKVE